MTIPAGVRGELVPPEVGSLWRKNDHGVWRPHPADGRHVVRVEGYTPLGRAVLRRVECQHEYVCDIDTLTRAFDPCEPHTMVWYDRPSATTHPGYPWRTYCIACGWSDTFDHKDTADHWASEHDGKHAADAPVSGSSSAGGES